MNIRLEVLISAMYQTDMSKFEDTAVSSDALLINQCENNSYVEIEKDGSHFRMISTTERGLSRSRNMALANAKGDYCLICDDDELLYEGYTEKIECAYQKYPDADIICFKVIFQGKTYSPKAYRIGFLRALRVSSVQMCLKLKSIKKAMVSFDVNFGSGTPVGSGEENIFLYDCLKKGLKVYYVPIVIGEVSQIESKWFKGFSEDYFIHRGQIIYRLMKNIGFFYCLYFSLTKYRLYKSNMSRKKAFFLMLKGMREQYKAK